MSNIIIAKIKARRGLDSERVGTVLEQGEFGYTIDTKRAFIGDGILSGGETVGIHVHNILPVSGSRVGLVNAYKNDIVYESNLMYQLTGDSPANLDSWVFVGTRADDSTLEYNTAGKLIIKQAGVTNLQIAMQTITPSNLSAGIVYSSGGLSLNPNLGLSANVDNNTIYIDPVSKYLSIKPGGVSNSELSAGAVDQGNISINAIGDGLSGAGPDKIFVHTDNETIIIEDGKVAVGTISADNIQLGVGMENNLGKLEHFVQTIDPDDLITAAGKLELAQKFDFNSQTFHMPNVTLNSKGTIIGANNGTIMPLSSNYAGYGGFPTQREGSETNTTVAVVTGVSASNVQILSSAGFMILNVGTPTITDGDVRNYDNAQYLAIQAFTIPQTLIDIIDNKFTFVETYPYEWVGYRAHDPTLNDYTANGNTLSSAACSGSDDYTGFAEAVIIYSDTPSLSVGTNFAATPTSLTSSEYNSLSGWINIEGERLYLVDGSNIVQSVSTCP